MARLAVVSKDLMRAVFAESLAPTLLEAIERWTEVEGRLQARYQELERGVAEGAFAFDSTQAMSPLPRCYQWLDGSTFANHGSLMERAFDIGITNEYERYPLVYQGASDDFIGPRDDVELPSESEAIWTSRRSRRHRRMRCRWARAKEPDCTLHVKLLDAGQRREELARPRGTGDEKPASGWVQAKPSTSFSPVQAVTPDELGDAWSNGRVELPLSVQRNGEWFGQPHGKEMTFNFFRLIEHTAYSRRLRAGTIIGSGTIVPMPRAMRVRPALPSGAPSRPSIRAARRLHSCVSVNACASKCSTPRTARCSGPSINVT